MAALHRRVEDALSATSEEPSPSIVASGTTPSQDARTEALDHFVPPFKAKFKDMPPLVGDTVVQAFDGLVDNLKAKFQIFDDTVDHFQVQVAARATGMATSGALGCPLGESHWHPHRTHWHGGMWPGAGRKKLALPLLQQPQSPDARSVRRVPPEALLGPNGSRIECPRMSMRPAFASWQLLLLRC